MSRFTILVDSREQAPWLFHDYVDSCAVRLACLSAGDYSLTAMCDGEARPMSPPHPRPWFALERKSLGDLFGTVGAGRERFKRELRSLAEYDYAALIIEAAADAVLAGPVRRFTPHGQRQLHPNAVLGSLKSWAGKYALRVFFCDGRAAAEALAYRLLSQLAEGRMPVEEPAFPLGGAVSDA